MICLRIVGLRKCNIQENLANSLAVKFIQSCGDVIPPFGICWIIQRLVGGDKHNVPRWISICNTGLDEPQDLFGWLKEKTSIHRQTDQRRPQDVTQALEQATAEKRSSADEHWRCQS
ncbi:hypothetical protein A3748_12165 [Erythrobacter sp. HI0077]|nr:hypothetical protein A3745_00720 [Erythrobacter sp. HI0074]KZZ08223.1 hypothetical protein A3748_12165 [Erythrobacter sp. HI0077]